MIEFPTRPYKNKKVPRYKYRVKEIKELRRKGWLPMPTANHILYQSSGRIIWTKTLFRLTRHIGLVLIKSGPSLERDGKEYIYDFD